VTDLDAMYEAHVQFELDRFSEPGLEAQLRGEVEALFAWLSQVSLAELARPETVVAVAMDAARGLDGPDALALISDGATSVQHTLRESTETVEDVLSRDDAKAWATTLAGLDDARSALMDQVTTSSAYTRLVAHVVYHGIKSYLLKENVLAKRIPGASSLVRLGQRGLGAAAPGLEQNVDRQLIAFVDANIADTVRDSQRFLDEMLDEDLVSSMSDEAWAAAADRPIAAAADLVTEDELSRLTELAWQQWRQLRDTALLERVVAGVVDDYYADHGSTPVADLLAGVGVTAEYATGALLPLAGQAVEHAVTSGYVESRIRERLTAFYESYAG